MSQEKKCRRPNWSSHECRVLREAVQPNLVIIRGRLSSSITKADKRKVWEAITMTVNTESGNGRTAEECEKKCANLQSMALKQMSAYKKESKKTGKPRLIQG